MGTTLIKKHLVRPFINKTPIGSTSADEWVQIKKATDFTRAMNPVTEERDYIADEHPTTEITDYKPSEALSITMYKGEADYDLFFDFYKNKAIGSDAQREYLLVYLMDSVDVTSGDVDPVTTTYYYAEKTNASITVDEMNTTSSTLTCTVYENGTSTKGYVTFTDGVPTFTAGDMPSAS